MLRSSRDEVQTSELKNTSKREISSEKEPSDDHRDCVSKIWTQIGNAGASSTGGPTLSPQCGNLLIASLRLCKEFSGISEDHASQ